MTNKHSSAGLLPLTGGKAGLTGPGWRYPRLLRWCLALLLVLVPVVLNAAPVLALSAAAPVANPNKAGAAASYTIGATLGAGAGLSQGVDTISITFPGGTTVPSSISRFSVSVDLTSPTIDPSVSGLTVTILTPATIAGGNPVSIVFSQIAGIKNPKLSGTTYTVQVATSKEEAVTSAAFTIIRWVDRSPTHAARGSAVTVAGAGFTPNTTASIQVGGTVVGSTAVTSTGTLSAAFLAGANGSSSGVVQVVDGGDGAVTSGPTFTMDPSIRLSPTSNSPGQVVTVVGSGFTASGTVPLHNAGGPWPTPPNTSGVEVGGAKAFLVDSSNNLLVAAPAMDASGNVIFRFRVPVTPVGSKTVTVTGSGGKSTTASLTVTALRLTVNPSLGVPGTPVTISGSGFTAGGNIPIGNLTYAGAAWNTAPISINGSGDFSTTQNVPGGTLVDPPTLATPGAKSIAVTGSSGITGTGSFTLSSRSLSISPTSGPRGIAVTATGTGFSRSPGTTNIAIAGTSVATASNDVMGAFTVDFTVPAGTPIGANAVIATDNDRSLVNASATFTVSSPTITLSPTSSHPGSFVTVAGTNYPPNTAITKITFGTTQVTISGVFTDAGGRWSTNVVIPDLLQGTIPVATAPSGGSANLTVKPRPLLITPSSGVPGASITISGTRFTPNGTVAIGALTFGPASLNSAVINIDSSGKFTSVQTVPGTVATAGSPGTKTIRVTDNNGLTGEGSLTMPGRTLTLSPNSGPAGRTLTATGTGFGKLTNTTISFPGATPITASNGVLGGFIAILTVSSTAPPGSYVVTAADNTYAAVTAAATFTVAVSTLTLTPNSAAPDAPVTISGSNYPSFTDITTIHFGTKAVSVGGARSDASGSWSASVTVPSLPIGSLIVTTTPAGGSASFTVAPGTLTITPSSGVPGASITVSGSNFTPNGTIAIGALTFSAVPLNTSVVSIDSTGSFFAGGKVPGTAGVAGIPGAKAVIATDSGGFKATATFTIPNRSLTVSPTWGRPSTPVTVTGTGFGSVTGVTIAFAGETVVIASPDAAGSFRAGFLVPLGAGPGTHTVVATDNMYSTLVATASFTIPSAVLSVSPVTGASRSTIAVSGSGYGGYISITCVNFGTVCVPVKDIVADATGAWAASVEVPPLNAGAVLITTTPTGGAASFTVTANLPTVSTTTEPIASKLVLIWSFDAASQTWSKYDPTAPAVSDLVYLKVGRGYWIHVTEDVTLVSGGGSYSLHAGWNLIGWLG